MCTIQAVLDFASLFPITAVFALLVLHMVNCWQGGGKPQVIAPKEATTPESETPVNEAPVESEPEAIAPASPAPALAELGIRELRKLALGLGLKGAGRWPKARLIQVLQGA